MRDLVGTREARDIDGAFDRVLRDLGDPDPPLSLPDVRELLRLDLRYYRLDDPSFVDEVAHRVRVAGKQVLKRPALLLEAIRKANLSALWVPDRKRILIDETIPKPKHRWIEAHEISHSLVPWHGDFLFGDTEFTLDPTCHATVEAEANYGAGRLLFLGNRFAQEARALPPTLASARSLHLRYGNTLTSTLWRFIEDRDPDHPAAGMLSIHPHHPEIGHGDGQHPWRYFIRSTSFLEQFSRTTALQIYALIQKHATWRTRGPILTATDAIANDRGQAVEFVIESFSNSYDLLTFISKRIL